ncbi:sensor histidine kinase [uncultured Lentibacter sp.]|uniref:sensor histidine kinase n=1 Tax=uncultured Lentibacter sp. TaxID=1659309 RepID=UPI00262FF3EE|nr:sensor histidine kinase [uncultured Lentibacter sp.]
MVVQNLAPERNGDVVLGDDFVVPHNTVDENIRARRERRGFFSLRRSPLARKIITFNLIAMSLLLAGILYLNSSRDGLALQRAKALISEAELVADVIEAQMPRGVPVTLATADGLDPAHALDGLDLREGLEVLLFDRTETLVARMQGRGLNVDLAYVHTEQENTFLTNGLARLWSLVSAPFGGNSAARAISLEEQARTIVLPAMSGQSQINNALDTGGNFIVATPVAHDGAVAGVIVLASTSGEIDYLVRLERERVLQMFLVGVIISVGLSVVLASTIANPLSDLAASAELGRDRDSRNVAPGRIRIPDLTARPDEIGRLSGALRGMVSALYDRIDANEQFAADVAHEIKNPLASLRSAVGTLRVAKREDQRDKLLSVIDHDVRRLDRLVSDISNASRLDSELVKEEQEEFDLLKMLDNLCQFLGEDAKSKGIDFISDLPKQPIILAGLEARVAQVFVNLISNAISFCEDGDAIRVWARQRENRVLVVVEDTGPGIPEAALTKIFKRFYSERPEQQFGNNSGLGLAISKQIVEAHDGVIWAENIRPTDADLTSEPLGARFVVGLPV